MPDLDAFAAAYDAGKAQVVSASLVADLETPVSALLKLADGRPYSFLLESVTGGAVRGRYSILGIKPDLIWRCRGDQAEINRRARFDRDAFEPCAEPALASLRALIAESRIELPDGLPLMARRPVRLHGLRHGPADRAPAGRQPGPAGPARRRVPAARPWWRCSTTSRIGSRS